ncbi:MAG: response regulator transcription factor [Bacteroidetes bacterium]|nr:MAG: response regulator transcription factor [Bacteroidota bacterium]
MKQPIRILIADDFPMFREGIRMLLGQERKFEIVGEAGNGDELVRVMETTKADIVITDIEMPVMNGIMATKEIKSKHPQSGVIALTMFGDDHLIVEMLDAGANGYLLKSTRKQELIDAIEAVFGGASYFCNSTSLRLSKMIAQTKLGEKNSGTIFSKKEIEIIKLICEQYASKQIAEVTNLTHRTVEKYRDYIMEKTNSKNMVGIVVYAIRHGLFKP